MLAEIMGRNTHIEFPLNLIKSDGADVSEPSVKGLRLYVVTYQLKTLVEFIPNVNTTRGSSSENVLEYLYVVLVNSD